MQIGWIYTVTPLQLKNSSASFIENDEHLKRKDKSRTSEFEIQYLWSVKVRCALSKPTGDFFNAN